MSDTNTDTAQWLAATKVRKFDNVEIADTFQYTWEISDWLALNERELSPPFECGGFRWQMLLFPQGNPASQRKGSIALYLNALGPATQNDSQDGQQLSSWYVCCSFGLAMWNPQYPSTIVTQSSQHRFTPRITDWGYNEFYTIRSAFVRSPKATGPLISASDADGKLKVNISVNMDVLADPTGVLWHDFQDYDSREATGYTGLVNQGATCYLNSLIQSLYFTKAFRSAVYSLPDSPGVSGGLQRIFYKLSISHPPVDTTDLTKAFGWDSADAFTQHDVQELARVLMDRLESKMKGTQVDGFLSKLFVGQMKSYIKCINVPFESARTEDFWDIQLNVRGMQDVYASFKDYCAEETLEGDNQYAAGEYGLQDAVKGVAFESLPPVLHLQLKRYDFDWMREIQVKINDRYEFPLDLDLSEFVTDNSRKWEYDLHGVLVHSGDLNAGHYYALIKPEAYSPNDDSSMGWYKFDDDRVTKATLHEVLDENFGGDERSLLRRVTSAYMLVYIRRDSKDFVLPSTNVDATLPREITEKIVAEQKAEELRQQALAEQQLYMKLQVITPDTLKHHRGPGILPWSSDSKFPPSEHEEPESLKLRVDTSLSTLMDQFNAGSLWLATTDDLSDTRACPRRLQMVPNPKEYSVAQLSSWTNIAKPSVLFAPDCDSSGRFVFMKKYENRELSVLGYKWIDASKPLVHELSELLSLYGPQESALHIEVTVPNHIELAVKSDRLAPLTEWNSSAAESNIENGEVLVVSNKNDNIVDYFEELHNSITLVLVPHESQDDEIPEDAVDVENPVSEQHDAVQSADSEKSVTVSVKDSYEAVVEKIGAVMNCDPKNLLLQSLPPRWVRSSVIDSSGSNVQDLWSYSELDTVKVIYRILPVPLEQFEQMSEVMISWLPNGYMSSEYSSVLLGNPDDKVNIGKRNPESLVVWVSYYGRKCKELPSPSLGLLAEYQDQGWDIFVSPLIPIESKARSTEGSKLCACFHFQGEPNRTHGIPFYIALVPNESFKETKLRMYELLRHGHTSDRSLEKIKFCMVHDRSFDTVYITDDSVILFDLLSGNNFLGLDHPDRSNNGYQQQAIHID